MKTITILAIDPDDQMVRENEILVSRIIGWYKGKLFYTNRNWTSYEGYPTTIVLDSGAEYEIAESIESFRARLKKIISDEHPQGGLKCSNCSRPMSGLQLVFPNVPFVFNIITSAPGIEGVQICRDCIVKTIVEAFSQRL